jgi:uncharacterized protein (UPF0332 family)
LTAVEQALERSRDDLEAARHLVAGGFLRQATSRSYYAAFHAAEAALLALGETRSKHSGVISAFAQLIVRSGEVDEATGRLLRSLFERRNEADYAGPPISAEDAQSALTDAETFVQAVDSWVASRETEA